MKTIIAGGRATTLEDSGIRLLDEVAAPFISQLVSGNASGIDREAETWAKARGFEITRFPADWGKHGKAAGPIRNREMAKFADALIAFPGGRGTNSMHSEAMAAGLLVLDLRFSDLATIERFGVRFFGIKMNVFEDLAPLREAFRAAINGYVKA